jgi:hypothetical protein
MMRVSEFFSFGFNNHFLVTPYEELHLSIYILFHLYFCLYVCNLFLCRQKDRLMLTGRVWDACDATERLPQNNLQVTCKIVQREESLVLDALQEIEGVKDFCFSCKTQ